MDSFKRQFAKKHESIPDDVYEEALAASQQDSDGENAFETQPRPFMQTGDQIRRQARDLCIRQLAFVLRDERRDQSSRFRMLPPELILKMMQHMELEDVDEFANFRMTNERIFEANKLAIYRGMEIERFPDWKWLFGNTVHRTSAQEQHLKDAISGDEWSFGRIRSVHEKGLLECLRTIDKKNFTGIKNIRFLEALEPRVDADIEAIESYTTKQIARRTAICLRSLSFKRAIVVKEEDRVDNGPLVRLESLPWEARSELIVEQPTSIQAEIRSLLMIAVQRFHSPNDLILSWWANNYYSKPGFHREAREVKKWMSKLVMGLILEEMVPRWYSESTTFSTKMIFEKSSGRQASISLMRLLGEYDEGKTDVLEEVEDVLQFGRRIGIEVEGLVDGTGAGNIVDRLGSSDYSII